MRKNVLKVFAASAALCFASGIIIMNGGVDTAKADDEEVIVDCRFDSEDEINEILCMGKTEYSIATGRNSSKVEGDTSTGSLKVVRDKNDGGWWERAGFKFDLKKLTPGKQYVVSLDFSHDGEAVMKDGEEKFDDMRAFKIGTYFDGGYEDSNLSGMSDEEKSAYTATHTAKYGQIGQIMGAPNGSWDTIVGYITIKEDVKESDKDYYLHLFMGYPEAVGNTGSGYKEQGVIDDVYYVDNFSIKEVPAPKEEPTETPTAAPTAEPSAEPSATPTAAPATEAPVVIPEDPGLEVGYEDAVKGVNYRVTGADTVMAMGFDEPKSSLVIPDTIVLEEATYKVTAINANAFKGEDIKSLVIGSNVASIGKSAFQNCSSLKKITFKSAVVKTIGKNAFKKTHKKANVKVPKAKKATYKKLLKKAGLSSKAKVK